MFTKKYMAKTVRAPKNAEVNLIAKIELPKINLVCLGFDDTKIIFDANLIQLIERELITYQPDLILTHWLYDTHQDHLNTAQAVVAAARYYYNIFF